MSQPFKCTNCSKHYSKLKKYASNFTQYGNSVLVESQYEVRGRLFMIKHCWYDHTDEEKNQMKRLIKIYNENGSFWKHGTEFYEEKPEECPICFESFSRDSPLECGHWVCHSCMFKSKKSSCPLCKQKVSKETKPPVEPAKPAPSRPVSNDSAVQSLRTSINSLRMELRKNRAPSELQEQYSTVLHIYEFLDTKEREPFVGTISQLHSYFN